MDPALLASGRRTGRAQMYGGENAELLRTGKKRKKGKRKKEYTITRGRWAEGGLHAVAEIRGAVLSCVEV